MKKLGTMVGLALVAIACAGGADMMGEVLDSGVPDAGAQPGDGADMKFVGVTSASFRAYDGIFPMYTGCVADFGAGHRVCTQAEILNTTPPPTLPGENERFWFQADLTSSPPCGGWASNGTSPNFLRAPTVNQAGQLAAQTCSNELPATCCGPT
jgi:hypothetical protein